MSRAVHVPHKTSTLLFKLVKERDAIDRRIADIVEVLREVLNVSDGAQLVQMSNGLLVFQEEDTHLRDTKTLEETV